MLKPTKSRLRLVSAQMVSGFVFVLAYSVRATFQELGTDILLCRFG